MYLIPMSLSVNIYDIQPMILVSTTHLSVNHEGSRITEDSHWHETQSVTYKPSALTHRYVTYSL